MTSVEDLYEIWSRDSELRETLKQSLDPRGTEWLFELFASLQPRADDVLVDVGCRDASHAIRLVREHGLRGFALDPLPLHVERARAEADAAGVELTVLEGRIEALPFQYRTRSRRTSGSTSSTASREVWLWMQPSTPTLRRSKRTCSR